MSDERLQEEYYGQKWVIAPIRLAEFAKTNADKLGIDGRKFVTGQALVSLIGDDVNIFYGLRFLQGTPQYLETARAGRLGILERLDWELTDGNFPPAIVRRLTTVQVFINEHSWTDQQATAEAFSIWSRASRCIERYIRFNPVLAEALDYFSQNEQRLQGNL